MWQHFNNFSFWIETKIIFRGLWKYGNWLQIKNRDRYFNYEGCDYISIFLVLGWNKKSFIKIMVTFCCRYFPHLLFWNYLELDSDVFLTNFIIYIPHFFQKSNSKEIQHSFLPYRASKKLQLHFSQASFIDRSHNPKYSIFVAWEQGLDASA